MYSEETKLDENNASADLILPEKRKLKKFLCTNSLLEWVALYCKRSKRSVLSKDKFEPNDTFWMMFVIK